MKHYLTTILLLFPLMMQAQYKSQVWSPDNGDGTFTNPVINADYSDPDVCVGASGEDFYLTASSFNCIPGLPILHSEGLGELEDCEPCCQGIAAAGALQCSAAW